MNASGDRLWSASNHRLRRSTRAGRAPMRRPRPTAACASCGWTHASRPRTRTAPCSQHLTGKACRRGPADGVDLGTGLYLHRATSVRRRRERRGVRVAELVRRRRLLDAQRLGADGSPQGSERVQLAVPVEDLDELGAGFDARSTSSSPGGHASGQYLTRAQRLDLGGAQWTAGGRIVHLVTDGGGPRATWWRLRTEAAGSPCTDS